MIQALSAIFTGELEPFAGTLVLPTDPRPAIAGPELIKPRTLDRIMPSAAKHLGEGDIRAQISLWFIDYVHVLMPVTVVANLVLNRRLTVRLDEVAVILDEEAMPEAIRLPHDGIVAAPENAFRRFEDLVHGHLLPLVEALSAYSGLSPRVLWTSAANLYEAIIRSLEQWPHMPSATIAEGNTLITSADWPDGRRNPFYRPVLYSDAHAGTKRWRRVCCVRYLISRYDYCSNCPHLLAARGKADKKYYLR